MPDNSSRSSTTRCSTRPYTPATEAQSPRSNLSRRASSCGWGSRTCAWSRKPRNRPPCPCRSPACCATASSPRWPAAKAIWIGPPLRASPPCKPDCDAARFCTTIHQFLRAPRRFLWICQCNVGRASTPAAGLQTRRRANSRLLVGRVVNVVNLRAGLSIGLSFDLTPSRFAALPLCGAGWQPAGRLSIGLAFAAVALCKCGWAATVQPVDLRCEYQSAPLAIESSQPRLSWELQAADPAHRNLRQTGYRIMVASSEALLVRERGDLWDTGRVSSSETIQIPYTGKTPAALGDHFWKVRIWDQDGNASAWSGPASWRMAPRPRAWKAKWIAAQADGTSPERHMPIFRHAFALPHTPARAIAYISRLGQYELTVNGEKVGAAVLTPGWTNYRKTVFYNAYDVTKLLRSEEHTSE